MFMEEMQREVIDSENIINQFTFTNADCNYDSVVVDYAGDVVVGDVGDVVVGDAGGNGDVVVFFIKVFVFLKLT